MRSWYLIHTKARRERTALENLERQGYEAYLPLVRNRRRIAGRYQARIEAMFPRYLFVRLDDAGQDWSPIRSTIGVSQLVRFGTRAATVPAPLVALLRAREDADGVQSVTPRPLVEGDRVRIVDGPLAGYEAVLQARSGSLRVVVLLEIAQRHAPIELPADDVEPLNPDWTLSASTARSGQRGG